MMNMDWERILKVQYQEPEGVEDDDLIREAIATCEGIFEVMDKNVLLHRSRPLAYAYLALKYEERRRGDPDG